MDNLNLRCCGNCSNRRSDLKHSMLINKTVETCSKKEETMESCEVCELWQWDQMDYYVRLNVPKKPAGVTQSKYIQEISK